MDNKCIQIKNYVRTILVPLLPELLGYVRKDEFKFWSVLFVDGILKRGVTETFSEIEAMVNKSLNPPIFERDEFELFCNKYAVVIDIMIIASNDKSKLRRYENDEALVENSDLIIELVDSSYWFICANDRVLSVFKNSIPGVFDVEWKGTI
jgi:hypothetical protein